MGSADDQHSHSARTMLFSLTNSSKLSVLSCTTSDALAAAAAAMSPKASLWTVCMTKISSAASRDCQNEGLRRSGAGGEGLSAVQNVL